MQKLQVLVTGAGSGIGEAIARRLADAGHQVWGTVRNAEQAASLNDERGELPGVRFEALELTDWASINNLADKAAAWGLNVLINNAGYSVFGAQELLTAEHILRQFQVNVFGPLELTRLLIPQLRSRQGTIIWLGSMMNYAPFPFQGSYAASKSAVAAFSDALAMELEPTGVRVFCIEPGDIATQLPSKRTKIDHAGTIYATRAADNLRRVEAAEHAGESADRVAIKVQRLLGRPGPPRVRVGRNTTLLYWLAVGLPGRLRFRIVKWLYGG